MGQADRSQGTIERITDAAIAVFSDKGFDGARVDAIAERAGVNKATLYYHIGDKEALYRLVLGKVIGDTVTQLESALSGLSEPEEKLRLYVRIFARAAACNPGMAPVMVRELASGSAHLPLDIALMYGRTIDLVKEILDEGIQGGVFIAASPLLIYVMVAGGVVLYHLTAPIRTRLEAEGEKHYGMAEGGEETIIDEIEQLIMNAVMKRQAAGVIRHEVL